MAHSPDEPSAHEARLTRRALLGGAVAAGAAAAAAPSIAHARPRARRPSTVVRTEHGQVAGRRTEHGLAFLGVPYAAPPTGALRFRSPARPGRWRGVRDALRPGASALQTVSAPVSWIYDPTSMLPMGEDCLVLNVWTPGVRGRRPVIVFIHGGASRYGSGTVLGIDGARMARDGDVVVVTMNYRLGALGLLSHPSWQDPRTGLSGNWGAQDVLASLDWVKRNIAAFGGDPGNVTVAGESWGAMAVRDITIQPRSTHLFDKAIASSGRLSPAQPADRAAEYTELLAGRLGVSVAGLRRVPATTLHAAELALSEDRAANGGTRLGLVVDGVTVLGPSPFGRPSAPVPLLVGTNRNESYWDYKLFDPSGRRINTSTAPADEAALLPAIAGALAANYPPGVTPPAPEPVSDAFRAAMDARGQASAAPELLMEVHTDVLRRGPSLEWAARHTQGRRGSAYVYEFAQPLARPGFGTPHAIDVPFVFGTCDSPFMRARVGSGARVAAASRELMGIWTRFAHTGDPAGGRIPRWRPYSYGRRDVAVIGGRRTAEVVRGPRHDQLKAMALFVEP